MLRREHELRGFEILDGGCAPQVEEILSDTEIASGVPLASGDVRERVRAAYGMELENEVIVWQN